MFTADKNAQVVITCTIGLYQLETSIIKVIEVFFMLYKNHYIILCLFYIYVYVYT